MTVKHVEDDDEFDNDLAGAGVKLVVMDFFATWCGPCRAIAPHFEELARQYPQALFLKIDVQKCDKAAQAYRIQAMPTFVFVRNGRELERIRGANASALDAAVKNHIDAPGESSVLLNWNDAGKGDEGSSSSSQSMHWYMGTVDSAVQETIKHKSTMLVFISNAEPSSRALLKSLEASPISKLSADRNKLIAVRLEENTTAATQFAAIYPVTIIPALYFISHAGKLLQVAGSEAAKPEVLLSKLKAAIPNYNDADDGKSSDADSALKADDNDEPTASSSSTAQLTLEEKVARARQLAKQKREQREAEQKQAELDREQERRRTAQLVQQSQRDRADTEIQKLADERRREKREKLEQRQKILKGIENDRLERQQRSGGGATNVDSDANIPKSTSKSATEPKKSSYQPPAHARILFRLPDSTTITQQFEPTSTMQAVAAFVEEQVQSNEFSMLTSMPMRRLDGEEMRQKTLADLDLYPTATIIVTLPRPAVAPHRSHHDSAHLRSYGRSTLIVLQAMFYMLCRFIVAGFDLLAGVFYREHWFAHRTRTFDNTQPELSDDGEHLVRPELTRDERRPAQEADRQQMEEQLRQRRNKNDEKSSSSSSSSNIKRLADLDKVKSDDDKKTTYNGNSTQQL